MIVNRNRNNLLGIILSDHKIIQLSLDLVWRWNIFDIQHRLIIRFFLFLLEFLLVRNTTISLQICQIDETDVWELFRQIRKV